MRSISVGVAGCIVASMAISVIAIAAPAPGRPDDCPPGIITTIAGSGEEGYSGDGGPAAEAEFNLPMGVALGPDGSLYIPDMSNHCIRKIDPRGIITTVAGSGKVGYSGDGGPAIEASLDQPRSVAVGADGSIYVADTRNNRIRRVDPAGIITTVAGSGARGWSKGGRSGDGGPAAEARLNNPFGVALGIDGSIYIADTRNNRIRRVDPAGIITTIAGSGPTGWGHGSYSGDGGPAAEATLNDPYTVAAAPDGSLFIADTYNNRVRRIDRDGIITTIAGDGEHRYRGDGGPAAAASLAAPTAVALAADGSLYIAVGLGHRVRKIDPQGIITTVAGEGDDSHWGDGGIATEASLRYPRGVAVAADGGLYIADAKSFRVRRLWWPPCEPEAAKATADDLRAKAGDSTAAWRQAATVYLIIEAWEDALAAAERAVALAPEPQGRERLRAEVLVARVYAAKRDDHEARRRLIRVLARGRDPIVLRDAGGALVGLYLLRGERDQAIATLQDLALRTKDRGLLGWVDRRLKEIAGG